MKASILAVGTELLFGDTVNTNAAFLSHELNLMGLDVMYHFVVGDNPSRLKDKLNEAFSDTDIVLITGGLGPTQDDLTKETVSEFMGVSLQEDEQVAADLNEYFSKRGKTITPNVMKQALLPIGSVPFYNKAGTAPAFAIENNGRVAVCMPGPPREMKYVFNNGIRQYLEQFVDGKMFYRIIRTIGIGESELETILLPLIDGQTDPTIATYAKEGECTLRIASKRRTLDEARQAVDSVINDVDKLIGRYIYSYDNEELNYVLVNELKSRGLKISCAESCTGGLFASSITDVPGASSVFDTSFVTYSEASKISNIGVPAAIIEEYGVSSPETAVSMAEAVINMTGSDIAISVTGNAGPDTYDGQESGQAYIGYSYRGSSGCVPIYTHVDDRKWNRNYFKLRMLRLAYQLITGNF